VPVGLAPMLYFTRPARSTPAELSPMFDAAPSMILFKDLASSRVTPVMSATATTQPLIVFEVLPERSKYAPADPPGVVVVAVGVPPAAVGAVRRTIRVPAVDPDEPSPNLVANSLSISCSFRRTLSKLL